MLQAIESYWNTSYWKSKGIQLIEICYDSICIKKYSYDQGSLGIETDFSAEISIDDNDYFSRLEQEIRLCSSLSKDTPLFVAIPDSLSKVITCEVATKEVGLFRRREYLLWVVERKFHLDENRYRILLDYDRSEGMLTLTAFHKEFISKLESTFEGFNLEAIVPKAAMFQKNEDYSLCALLVLNRSEWTILVFGEKHELLYSRSNRLEPVELSGIQFVFNEFAKTLNYFEQKELVISPYIVDPFNVIQPFRADHEINHFLKEVTLETDSVDLHELLASAVFSGRLC